MVQKKFDIKNYENSSWFFNIRRIDTSYQDYDESQPHQHQFYQFLFFEEGSGIHTIDEVPFEVKPNSLHFISPNHVHHLELHSKTTGFVCMFKEELFFIHDESAKFIEEITLFSNWNRNPVMDILEADFNELKSILTSIQYEFDQKKIRKNEIILMQLKVFLMKSSRLAGDILDVKKNKKNLILNFLGLVEELYNKNTPVSSYAEKLKITTTYLNRLVNEVYGKSVSEFINERIALEAKRIIRLSEKSVKEISFELGFEDPSYFSRFFKKHVNLTPNQYRKMLGINKDF